MRNVYRYNEYKFCKCCGTLFFRRINQNVTTWKKSNYCSESCSQIRFSPKQYDNYIINKILSLGIGRDNGCIEYTGSLSIVGYGKITYRNKTCHAHRILYKLIFPETLNENYILHHCDNRKCINIDHLYDGTPKDNMQDKVKRNRCGKGFVWRNKKININEVPIIMDMILKNIPYTEIAKKYNVSDELIRTIAYQNGYSKYGPNLKTEDIDKIIDMLRNNNKRKYIAKIFNVAESTISTIAIKNGYRKVSRKL